MAETTTSLRLMAAAKEFNVGKDTLVDFLVAKGFSKDDLKPNSKLTDDMYRSLQQEFQGDKVAKIKSDQIDLPKGSLEAKKKKEEEPLPVKKEIPVVKKAPVKEEAPVPEEPVVVPVIVAAPPPPVVDQTPAETEITKIEAPELEGPKVIDKIDLSAIDSSTRPKKGKKEKEKEPEAPVVEEQTPAARVDTPPVAAVREQEEESSAPVSGHTDEETPVEEDENPPVIENIKAEKLEGPKILGKIDLPANSDTRPKQPSEEKRKRKRIPIEKRESGGGQQQRPPHDNRENRQGNQHGSQHGPGQHASPGNPRPPGQSRIPIQRNTGGRPAGAGAGAHGGGNRRGDPRHQPREAKEIDKKEIQ
jgi:translation initiation factor IF-2